MWESHKNEESKQNISAVLDLLNNCNLFFLILIAILLNICSILNCEECTGRMKIFDQLKFSSRIIFAGLQFKWVYNLIY